LKKEIVETFAPFHPEKIILFGSLAHGNYDEHSDIDIILVYRTDKRFMERLKELYLAWEIPKSVDILAYTPEEFKHMMAENSFVQDSAGTGKVIYEKH
jgi:predicted nucleotidyltransferase